MLLFIPLACFIIIFLVIQKSQTGTDWRHSFLSASLLLGLLLTAITEFLSLFIMIGFWEVLGLWLLSIVFALICLVRVNGSFTRPSWPAGISWFEIWLLTGMTLIIITVGVTGWKSPPNTWDSMTYHMSRVVHWIQNGSVANYPTHILRQLYQSPLAEFAIMQVQILSGGDRFANFIQWFSMIGSALGVSLLAKQFGASLRGQIFAAVISVTIPMGILQGSSTQNDYVISFWLVCFTYFVILLKEKDKPLYALAAGVGLGLSILTKPTAYIFAFPFMAWVSLSLIKSRHARGLLQIILIVIVAFVINLGHYTRSYDLFGSPLGPGQDGDSYKFSNDIFTLSSVTSNVIRNIGLHISTPSDQVNAFLEKEIYNVHRVIGIDPNDPRTTWTDTEFHIIPLSYNEDLAGNPLHLLLIMVSISILVLQQQKKDTIYYFVCLAGAFILFSLYPKWQPWHSRLHLPLFILWSSLIGVLLSQLRIQWIANLCIVILLVGALPYVLNNSTRPILGQDNILAVSRTEQYFRNRPLLIKPYTRSAKFLSDSKCSDIGLVSGGNDWDDWEYPFWVMLGENGRRTIRLEHVNVTNISQVKYGEFPFNSFTPCAVIVLSENPPNDVRVGNITYLRKMLAKPVSIFMQK